MGRGNNNLLYGDSPLRESNTWSREQMIVGKKVIQGNKNNLDQYATVYSKNMTSLVTVAEKYAPYQYRFLTQFKKAAEERQVKGLSLKDLAQLTGFEDASVDHIIAEFPENTFYSKKDMLENEDLYFLNIDIPKDYASSLRCIVDSQKEKGGYVNGIEGVLNLNQGEQYNLTISTPNLSYRVNQQQFAVQLKTAAEKAIDKQECLDFVLGATLPNSADTGILIESFRFKKGRRQKAKLILSPETITKEEQAEAGVKLQNCSNQEIKQLLTINPELFSVGSSQWYQTRTMIADSRCKILYAEDAIDLAETILNAKEIVADLAE